MTSVSFTNDQSSRRLDLWLASEQGISRTAAQELVRRGAVTVNGNLGRPGQKVVHSDQVVVNSTDVSTPPTEDIPIELNIVYEDEHLAVVNKPAGLVVYPAPGHDAGTLADGLRQRGETWSTIGGIQRAGIVHRLDRMTSGLMVVAKTDVAHHSLAHQLSTRTMQRLYWALVWGGFPEDSGHIDAPIGRHPQNGRRMAVVENGRRAETDFVVRERLPHTTVLEVRLRTGRTHQIRVHCAYIGKPLVGDPVYGRRNDAHRERPALHARAISFRHPHGGRECSFECPLPAELVALLNQARQGLVQ